MRDLKAKAFQFVEFFSSTFKCFHLCCLILVGFTTRTKNRLPPPEVWNRQRRNIKSSGKTKLNPKIYSEIKTPCKQGHCHWTLMDTLRAQKKLILLTSCCSRIRKCSSHFSPMHSITLGHHHNQDWCEWDSAHDAGADTHLAASLQASQAATLNFPRKKDKASH